MIHTAQSTVDLNKRFNRITLVLDRRRVCRDFRNKCLNETVLESKIAASEFLGKHFVPEFGGDFIPGRVASDDRYRSVRRPIIFKSEERESQILRAFYRICRKETRSDLRTGNYCVV